ncbi:uncharacterized protein LOC127775368 [Oryza glaberrima]|uniref:Uncharacterized protein n=2 Tax=Oryza TaxID=4527 RepID=A0A0D3GDW5_9ORYZ|nr:uncharacterized protein LOC127775368 [Oryza glaberrima]
MASAPTAAACFGLLVAMWAIGLVSYLDQFLGALMSSARALPPLDVAVEVVMAVAAIGSLNTAMASIYFRVYNGRAAAANRRMLDGACFAVCASASVLLHLIFFLQPGAMDGADQDLLPLAAAVVRALLPASAAVTFFASIILVYAYLRSGGAGAGTGTSVKLLTKVTNSAALVTIVLSLVVAAIVVFYSE